MICLNRIDNRLCNTFKGACHKRLMVSYLEERGATLFFYVSRSEKEISPRYYPAPGA